MNFYKSKTKNLQFEILPKLCIKLFAIYMLLLSLNGCSKADNKNSSDDKDTTVVDDTTELINKNANIDIKLIHPESLEYGEPMRYTQKETSEGIFITPHSRNLDGIYSGKRFHIPRVCSFIADDGFECVEFLSFDTYIENNSDIPISLDELYLAVENSKTDEKPYLYLGTTEDVSNSMIIVNGSWVDYGNLTLEYKLLKKGETFKNKYDFKRIYPKFNDHIVINFTDDLVKLGYNWDYIKQNYCSSENNQEYVDAIWKETQRDDPNSIYYPFEWTSNEWVCEGFCRIYGRITFSKTDQIIEFKGELSLSTEGGFGAMFEYDDSFNVKLKPDGQKYTVSLPYITTIQPNDAERVKFVIRCDKSSNHKFSIRAKDSNGNIYSSKDIDLHYMMPKHCDKDNGRRNE